MNSGAGSGANTTYIHIKREKNIKNALRNAAAERNMRTGTAPPASAVGTFRMPTMKNIKPNRKIVSFANSLMGKGSATAVALEPVGTATPVALDPAIYLPTPTAPPAKGGKSRKSSRRVKSRRSKAGRKGSKTRRH